MTQEQAILSDIELCDMGMSVLRKGTKLYKQYAAHRKACFDAIKAMNKRDGVDNLSDDELLNQLFAA